MPAAWNGEVRNLWISGNNTEGVIGIRYRSSRGQGANSEALQCFISLTTYSVQLRRSVPDGFSP